MISLRPELEDLAAEGLLAPGEARLAIAVEERKIVSVHGQLRFLLWAGVAMVVGGAGIWFTANLDRLGPAVVTMIGAIMAAAAYVAAFTIQSRSKEYPPPMSAEYLGLLGALLLSADVAWAESQFTILSDWTHHFLILTVVHAAFAYVMENRLVITLAVTTFAAWFGVDRQELFDLSGLDGGVRLLTASGSFLIWRTFHIRRPSPRFEPVLEHAMIQLAYWGCLVWITDEGTRWLALVALLLIGGAILFWSRRTGRHDIQVIWAGIYTLIGIDIVILDIFNDGIFVFLWLTVSSLAAIFGLITFFISRRSSQ